LVKFLVDESTGKKLCESLVESGYDAIYVGDVIPGSSDEDVLKLAESEERILITNDKDFGELVYRLNKPSSGVILLRLKKDTPKTRIEYVFSLLDNMVESLKGKFVVLTEMGYRIRKIE
jgi:predicted nuclease of predicted toxin-antitoxin system